MRIAIVASIAAACSSNPEPAQPQPSPEPAPAADTEPAPAAAEPEPEPAADTEPAPAAADSAPADPDPVAGSLEDKKALAGDMIVMFEQIAAAVQANEDDCEAMATALDGIATNSAELIERLNKISRARDPEFEKWFNETHGERMKRTMTTTLGSIQKNCGTDEGVKNAFSRLMPS